MKNLRVIPGNLDRSSLFGQPGCDFYRFAWLSSSDSVFTLRPDGEGTTLELTMNAKPYKLIPGILNPLMKGGMTKALARNMDAVKVHWER